MADLKALVAAHPLRNKKPYSAIKFVRVDSQGTPLYRVGKDLKAMGAVSALKAAFECFGGHCFHCKAFMDAQAFSSCCTLDHLKPRKNGGTDDLYNLVYACLPCNRKKGSADLICFNVAAGAEYMDALAVHLKRCLRALGNEQGVVADSEGVRPAR